MAHFGMCSDASPVVLLRLFPSLVSPETLKPLLPDTPGTDQLPLESSCTHSTVAMPVLPDLNAGLKTLETLNSSYSTTQHSTVQVQARLLSGMLQCQFRQCDSRLLFVLQMHRQMLCQSLRGRTSRRRSLCCCPTC